jgi:hypothetical protein
LNEEFECKAYIQGKFTRNTPKYNYNRAIKPLYRLYIDTIRVSPTSYNGYKYIILYTNDFSSYREVDFSKNKETIYLLVVNKLEAFKLQYNSYPKVLRTDNGTEFNLTRLNSYLSSKGILLELSTPYTPE